MSYTDGLLRELELLRLERMCSEPSETLLHANIHLRNERDAWPIVAFNAAVSTLATLSMETMKVRS